MAYSDKPIVQGLWAEEQSAGLLLLEPTARTGHDECSV